MSDENALVCGEPWSATDYCILPAGHGGRHQWSAEPPPKEPRAMWHSAARYVGWLPPDEVERRIAKRFSEVLKLHVEDLRGEELDRKVRELVSKDMYPPGAPVMSLDDMREVLRSKEGWVSRDELNERIAEAESKLREELTAPCHGLGCGRCEDCVQMARDEALEDAARVTDAARNNPDNYKRGMDAEDMAGFILDAIRDLKSKKETP